MHAIRDRFKIKTLFFLEHFFQERIFSINQRPGLPLRKYGMPVYNVFSTDFVLFIFGFVLSFFVGLTKN